MGKTSTTPSLNLYPDDPLLNEYQEQEQEQPELLNEYQEDEPVEDDGAITQEECWVIITAFFNEKGLVRQQLDSFNDFLAVTLQQVVDENASLVLHQPAQHNDQPDDINVFLLVFLINSLAATIYNQIRWCVSLKTNVQRKRWNHCHNVPIRSSFAKSHLLCTYVCGNEKGS